MSFVQGVNLKGICCIEKLSCYITYDENVIPRFFRVRKPGQIEERMEVVIEMFFAMKIRCTRYFVVYNSF